MSKRTRWWHRRGSLEPSPTEPKVVVIGSQMAAASAAEERHQEIDHGPPPFDGTVYTVEEQDLVRLVPSALDAVVAEVVDGFRAADGAERTATTARLTMTDQYTVLTFARRSSVATIRSRDLGVARQGLAALALVDCERVDWRDLVWAAQLLAYAVHRLGGDVTAAFAPAVELAAGSTRDALADLADEEVHDLGDLGHREIETADGIGFIEDDGEPYEPVADLLAIARAIAAGLAGDPWTLDPPTVGASIAAVWLRSGAEAEVDDALADVTGCLSLSGRLDSVVAPEPLKQHLLAWVVETRSPRSAQILADAVTPRPDAAFVSAAAVQGATCAMVIARAFAQDAVPYETATSIRRFQPIFGRALGG